MPDNLAEIPHYTQTHRAAAQTKENKRTTKFAININTARKRLRQWTVNNANPSLLPFDIFTDETDSFCK